MRDKFRSISNIQINCCICYTTIIVIYVVLQSVPVIGNPDIGNFVYKQRFSNAPAIPMVSLMLVLGYKQLAYRQYPVLSNTLYTLSVV